MKHALSKRQCNLPQDRETLAPTVNRALLTERLKKVKWGSYLSYNMACLSQLESLKPLAVKAINSRKSGKYGASHEKPGSRKGRFTLIHTN